MTVFTIPYNLPDKQQRKQWMTAGMCSAVTWSWVIPFTDWIGKRKCLEIMSGRGVLAYALQQLGISIVPTDNFSWASEKRYTLWHDSLIQIEELDCLKAIRKYGALIELMIMSWPPYNDPIAYRATRELYRVNPNALIIYIGEDRLGHTADDKFFDHFKEIKDTEFENAVSFYESWYGVNDYPHLGRYKP